MLIAHWTSLQIAAALYVFAGLTVKGIVVFRGMRIRRSQFKGEPVWDSQDNSRNALFMFLAAADVHPIGIGFQLLLWPIWLVWLAFSTRRVQKWLESQDT
jgi:hypothetical protein